MSTISALDNKMNRRAVLGKISWVLLSATLASCTFNIDTRIRANYKDEVRRAETAFAQKAASDGIADAFYLFADKDATIKRENDTLIHGRENIRHYYSRDKYSKASVTWTPDAIEVSNDGTLAYTYGKYVWTVSDSLGSHQYRGVFHTVWKRTNDGSWKYVWD